MNTMTRNIEKVIENETGYRYSMIDLAFSAMEDKITDLGTLNEDEDEVIFTQEEEILKVKLTKQLENKIDKTFRNITKMLKSKHKIVIEAPTHKDFGYLLETEMADFMDEILSRVEEVEHA